MFEFVYQVAIYPLEFLLRLLLEYLYSLTNSYGIAIVLLSLLVNLLLIPFYLLSEKWQATEQNTQLKMHDKVMEIKGAYRGYERHALLRTLYRQHDYNPAYALKSVAGLLVQIPFFIAAYQLLLNSHNLNGESFAFIPDLASPDKLINFSEVSINILPFVMTFITLASAYVYGLGKDSKSTLQQYIIASVFLFALYSASSALLIYWTASNIFNLLKNLVFRIVPKQTRLSFFESSRIATDSEDLGKKLFILGWMLVFFASLVLAPLSLLSSGSFVDFSEKLSFYMTPLLGACLYCLIAGVIIWRVQPIKLAPYLGGIFCFIALAAMIGLFAFAEDYGDMSNFVFEQGYIHDIDRMHINTLVLMLTAFGVGFFIIKKWQNILVNVLTVCLLSSVSLALFYGYDFRNKRVRFDNKISLYDEQLFSLSTRGKNVIVVMMDRMVGGYIPEALRILPKLESELEGFVWYPKTLSPGSYTVLGVPTIAGGYDYLASKVNNEKPEKKLAQRVDEAFRVMPYNFSKAGFKSSLIQPSSIFNPANDSNLDGVELKFPYYNYHKYWRKRNNIEMSKSDIHRKLAYFGLFRASPLLYRRDIYSDGAWQPFQKNNDIQLTILDLLKRGLWSRSTYYGGLRSEKTSSALKNWSIMEDLALLSESTESEQNKFYFFSNELTHEPWSTTPELEIELHKPIIFPTEDMLRFQSKSSVQHVYTVAATMKHIAKWIAWMKKANVYDNSRIIIVSDHGRNVFNPMFNKQQLTTKGDFGRRPHQAGWFHSTLLVKDFDSRENFRTSNKFMTTADVPWLALDKIIEGVNPYTGEKIIEPVRKTPWHVSFTPWQLRSNGKYKYKINKYFSVENEDIFDTSNWSEPIDETNLPSPSIRFK